MNYGGAGARHSLFVLLRRMRTPLVVLILAYAVAVLGFVLVPGVTPEGRPWRMDFLHATYFVSFLGTTIGLGEIPYPFSPAQRLWGTVSIYLTVLAWLYSIGALLNILQDPLMRRLLAVSRFERQVRRLHEPFYILCGYDDAGRHVTRELCADDIPVVVLEQDAGLSDAVEVDQHALPVPALQADASDPQALLRAGLRHPLCQGVLALTGNDAVNTKVALSARLLAPTVKVLCAVHHHEWHARMKLAGADALINPFDSFAERMAIALAQPSLHVIYEALTAQRHGVMHDVNPLPRGRWLLCGWTPLSRALRHRLQGFDIDFHVIDANADAKLEASCDHLLRGCATDAGVLRKAQIEDAQVLVAATDDDIDNLAIAVAARQLAPDLPVIVRRTQSRNAVVFRESGARLVMATGYMVATEVLRHTRAPLLAQFLQLAARQDEAWAAALLQRLRGQVGDEILESWAQSLRQAQSFAELRARVEARSGPQRAVPLMRLRQGDAVLVQGEDFELLPDDLLLMTGCARSRRQFRAWARR